jgi:hypothetical protein
MVDSVLTDTERRLLFRRCFDHVVASCEACDRAYTLTELASTRPGRRRYDTCPQCRSDLTGRLLDHLDRCRVLNPPIA